MAGKRIQATISVVDGEDYVVANPAVADQDILDWIYEENKSAEMFLAAASGCLKMAEHLKIKVSGIKFEWVDA